MSAPFIQPRQVCLLIGEKLREVATRQGTVPFRTGDLRKSHVVHETAAGAVVGSNLPYARAVHDGRPALIIRPKTAKALFFPGLAHPVKAVHQPAREGRPWLQESIGTLKEEGLGFLAPMVGDAAAQALEKALRKSKSLKVTGVKKT